MWCEEGFLMFTRSKAAIFESLADLLRAQGYTPEVIASLKPKVTTEIGHRITETKQEMIIRPGKLQRPRIPPHSAIVESLTDRVHVQASTPPERAASESVSVWTCSFQADTAHRARCR